jgi:hypothetical protein
MFNSNIYPINDQWAKNHPHKLILIKQIINHPVTYRIITKYLGIFDLKKLSCLKRLESCFFLKKLCIYDVF